MSIVTYAGWPLQVATGYAPLLIQMYATAAFDFNQADNGWLMSEFAFVRGFFLMFIFPRLISVGRKFWTNRTATSSHKNANGSTQDAESSLVTDPGEFRAPSGQQVGEEPLKTAVVREEGRPYLFDLVFLRWSLVVDGALTMVAGFATKRWHIYLGEHL